jgi:hypothetical protein
LARQNLLENQFKQIEVQKNGAVKKIAASQNPPTHKIFFNVTLRKKNSICFSNVSKSSHPDSSSVLLG